MEGSRREAQGSNQSFPPTVLIFNGTMTGNETNPVQPPTLNPHQDGSQFIEVVQQLLSTPSASMTILTTKRTSNFPNNQCGSSTMDRLINLGSTGHLKKPLFYLRKVWDMLTYILRPHKKSAPLKHFKLSPNLTTAPRRHKIIKPSSIVAEADVVTMTERGAMDVTAHLMDKQQVKEELMEKKALPGN